LTIEAVEPIGDAPGFDDDAGGKAVVPSASFGVEPAPGVALGVAGGWGWPLS